MDAKEIEQTARQELEAEARREAIDAAKARLKAKRKWFPWRFKIYKI